MATSVRFVLRKDKDGDDKPIFLMFNYGEYKISINGKRIAKPFKYSTNSSINPKYWDTKKERANAKYTRSFGIDLNSKLDQYFSTINNIYRAFELKKIRPTSEGLRQKMNEEFRDYKVIQESENIVDYIQNYIIEQKDKKSVSTIQKYNQISDKLGWYEEHLNTKINFTNLTEKMYKEFYIFCNQKYIEENGIAYTKNAMHNIEKYFTKFLRLGQKKYYLRFDFTDAELKYPEEDVDHIYLTLDEITNIYNIDLTNFSASYNSSRNAFIVMALTGLRVENLRDLQNLKVKTDKDINDDECYYITLINNKTKVETVIPILAPILKMYRDNGNKFPKFPTSQTIAKVIKKIGRLVKISEMTTLHRSRYDDSEPLLTEKYKLIANHTARRSFVTNCMELLVPDSIIFKITHPKTKKTVQEKYDKLSQVSNVKLFFLYIRKNPNAQWLVDYSE